MSKWKAEEIEILIAEIQDPDSTHQTVSDKLNEYGYARSRDAVRKFCYRNIEKDKDIRRALRDKQRDDVDMYTETLENIKAIRDAARLRLKTQRFVNLGKPTGPLGQ